MPISADAHVAVLTNAGDPFVNAAGIVIPPCKLTFQLVKFGTSLPAAVMDGNTGELITCAPINVITDENGEFTTNLWNNARGSDPTAYKVTSNSKYIQPFHILLQSDLTTQLVNAKTNYLAGDGAVSLDAFAAALAGSLGLSSITDSLVNAAADAAQSLAQANIATAKAVLTAADAVNVAAALVTCNADAVTATTQAGIATAQAEIATTKAGLASTSETNAAASAVSAAGSLSDITAGLAGKAPIASPTFTGNVAGLGTATGTSFNSITGLASAVSPMNGTATVGTSTTVARQDHVHARDTGLMPLAGTAGAVSFGAVTATTGLFVKTGDNSLTIQTNSSGSPAINLSAAGSDGCSFIYDRTTSELRISNSGATNAVVLKATGAVTIGGALTAATLNTAGWQIGGPANSTFYVYGLQLANNILIINSATGKATFNYDASVGGTLATGALTATTGSFNGNVGFVNGTGFNTANTTIRSLFALSGANNQYVTSTIDFKMADYADQGVITFATNNSTGLVERMRISNTGAVTIGGALTAGSVSGASLASASNVYVAGGAGITPTDYTDINSIVMGANTTGSYGWLQSRGASAGNILSLQPLGGTVLIGLTAASTGAKLEVGGSISATGSMSAVSTGTGTYGLNVSGAAGAAARYIAIFGHTGISNGVTIKSTGTAILLNIANIPTSSSGLSSGDVWKNGNVLNIV